MADSVFGDKGTIPEEQGLYDVLNSARSSWDEIFGISGGIGEWKFYSKNAGWTYVVKSGKRTLFYMTPKEGWFKVIFVLGKRAVDAAGSADLPGNVFNDLMQSREYMEGRSLSVDVKDMKDIDTIRKLLKLKLEY